MEPEIRDLEIRIFGDLEIREDVLSGRITTTSDRSVWYEGWQSGISTHKKIKSVYLDISYKRQFWSSLKSSKD